LVQTTGSAWQDFSFDGSQVQLDSGGGVGALPPLPSLSPEVPAEPLPLHEHCSVLSQRKPLPQSLAVAHGST